MRRCELACTPAHTDSVPQPPRPAAAARALGIFGRFRPLTLMLDPGRAPAGSIPGATVSSPTAITPWGHRSERLDWAGGAGGRRPTAPAPGGAGPRTPRMDRRTWMARAA